jgi:hypothetical protein
MFHEFDKDYRSSLSEAFWRFAGWLSIRRRASERSFSPIRLRRPSDDRSVHKWVLYALDKHTGDIAWERLAYEGAPIEKRQ